MTNTGRLKDEELARYRALSTSTIADALDRLGLPGAVEGIGPTVVTTGIAGHAYTVAYLPRGAKGGTVGDFLDEIGRSDVVVIDNRGRTDCTVWGNIMTEVAKARGVEGTVIDGVNRDLDESRTIGYPIWSRRGHMRTGKDRVVLQATNVPVCLGTVRVDPGDIVRADANGVMIVPLDHAIAVLELAEEIDKVEERILSDVRDGMTLSQSRSRNAYHTLQTPTGSTAR